MRRLRGLAGLAGLLGLGAIAAGLADPLPGAVRAVGALVFVLALPAFLPGAAFERLGMAAGRPALRIPLSLLLWLCVLALWTSVFTLAGASFRVYAVASTWMLLAVYALGVALSLRSRAAAPAAGAAPWWILAAACALFAVANPPELSVGQDGLDHAGYLRCILADNTLRPAGVLALLGGEPAWTDPRKGALHPVLALVAWISSTDPLETWRRVPVIMFPAAALSLLALNGAFLATRAAQIAAGALALLTYGGTPLRFAAASPHGEIVAAMWCWVLVALAVVRAARPPRWYVWTLLAFGGVLVHLGVAWHALVLAATMAGFGGMWGMPARARIGACVALGAGTAFALAVRHEDLAGATNLIHSHVQGVMFVAGRWFVASPMELLRLHGLLFLGGLVCVPLLVLARARRDARLVLAAAAVPLAVSFVPWIATWLHAQGTYMVFRSLLQVPVFAAIVVCAAALAVGIRRRARGALLLGVPAAALWLLVFLRPVPAAIVRDARSGEVPAGLSRELIQAVASLPSGSVVLSDPATSYVLSAHTSQRLVAVYEQHGNPRDVYALERLRAVRDVLSPFVVSDVAVAACRRFGVNYVVINGAPPGGPSHFLPVWHADAYPAAVARMQTMGPAFTLIASPPGASIFRFEALAAAGRGWTTADQPVAVASPALEKCEIEAPAALFRVTGVALDPPRARPGETVRVTLGYEHDSMSPFSFASVVHVRFDHAGLGDKKEMPGEKQWRRFADRRAGHLSRFRADLRPGHGVYGPDLWPVGYALAESFPVVVPTAARPGEYRVELSIESQTQVPNFHLRDLFFNRDHYSGIACTAFTVVRDAAVGEP